MKTIGSKVAVWHGNAMRTSGGLTKSDLMKNKRGKIVSKKRHFNALRDPHLPELEMKPKPRKK